MGETDKELYDVEQLKEIQQIDLKLLDVFKRICSTHGLRYFAIGGTCIGAVRHKGFIPWDDDIDVAMPLKDYRIFLEVAEKELKYPFNIISHKKTKHYLSIFSKIEDMSTTFIEESSSGFEDRFSGVSIDIFPVSGLPQNKLERRNIVRKIELLKKVNYKLRFPLSNQYGLKAKILWILMSPLRLALPFYWATKKQYSILNSFKFNESDKVFFPWRRIPGNDSGSYKNIFFYDDFKDTIDVPFEDTTICIPSGYDRYLKMDFGNYLKLPDKDKRVPMHINAIIDLKTPYSFYKKGDKR